MPALKKEKQLRDLDTNRIAEVAIAVIDKHGAAGFTMRAVANELGVTPMALYHHVVDKSGLAELVVDRALREVALPPTTDDWREDLWAIANWMRKTTLAHPALARVRGELQLPTPTTLQLTERWLGLWQRSGLEFNKIVLAARSSRTAIVGFVMEELVQAEIERPDDSMLSTLPNTRLLFDSLADGEAEFELAARSLIDSIYARLAAD